MSPALDFLTKLFFSVRAFRLKKLEEKEFQTLAPPKISCLEVTKYIALLKKVNKSSTTTEYDSEQQERALVLVFGWLSAQRKHIYKFAEIWLEMGYDVLVVDTKAWQLSWPVMGTQVVANDVLKFLLQNDSYSRIILHGFSVGAYQWSEVMVQMTKNMDQYQKILDKIVGQVWDSGVDVAEAHIGVPAAVFPSNKLLAAALGKYMSFHLSVFNKVVTTHLVKASERFHNTIVRAPALIIVSNLDPIGNVGVNKRIREDWETLGIKVYWKCFEKSPHVGHFRKYPEEYLVALYTYLDSI